MLLMMKLVFLPFHLWIILCKQESLVNKVKATSVTRVLMLQSVTMWMYEYVCEKLRILWSTVTGTLYKNLYKHGVLYFVQVLWLTLRQFLLGPQKGSRESLKLHIWGSWRGAGRKSIIIILKKMQLLLTSSLTWHLRVIKSRFNFYWW